MHNACMYHALCTMHALKLHCATLCRVSGPKTGETLDALEMLDSNGCIRLHPPLLVEPLLWWLVRLSLRNTWSGSPGFSSTHIAPHRTTSHHRTTLLVLYSFKTNTPIVSPMWLWDDTTKSPPPPSISRTLFGSRFRNQITMFAPCAITCSSLVVAKGRM